MYELPEISNEKTKKLKTYDLAFFVALLICMSVIVTGSLLIIDLLVLKKGFFSMIFVVNCFLDLVILSIMLIIED